MIPIRAERKGRGWSVYAMAKRLRDAADDPTDVPDLESIRHNIHRWESGGSGPSERYRLLYCQVFGRTEFELFGIEPPDIIPEPTESNTTPSLEAVVQFGDMLASLIGERGLSLREVARRVGISAGYLSNIRQGRKFPGAYTARRLDDVLDAGGELQELAQARAQEIPEEVRTEVSASNTGSRRTAGAEGISLSLPYMPCRVVIEISAPLKSDGNLYPESTLRLVSGDSPTVARTVPGT